MFHEENYIYILKKKKVIILIETNPRFDKKKERD